MRTFLVYLAGLAAVAAVGLWSGPVALDSQQRTEPVAAQVAGLAHPSDDAAAMGEILARIDAMPSADRSADLTLAAIPDDRAALDMAVAYLVHGQDARLREMARQVMVVRQRQIVAALDGTETTLKLAMRD